MVQRSITMGSRDIFYLLVNAFHADVRRPWSRRTKRGRFNAWESEVMDLEGEEDTHPWIHPTYGGRLYLNCYSHLAMTSKDVWFA
jgi:hypothetical protein